MEAMDDRGSSGDGRGGDGSDRDAQTSANTLATVLMGAAAGAVGVWALDRIDWFMWNRESDETRADRGGAAGG